MMSAPDNIEDILSLSPMQQGMLYHSILAPGSGTYVEQTSWTLSGQIDVTAFQCAWEQVVSRHMALRAGFLWEGLDEPLQVVSQEVKLPFVYQDWSSTPTEQQPEKLTAFLEADRQEGFELAAPPLMRMALIRLAADKLVFIWSHHHLLLDGWSQPILLGEFLAIYQSLAQGRPVMLPAAYPYSRYIAWLQQQDYARAEQAWRSELAGFRAPNELKFGFPQPAAGEPSPEAGYAVQKRLLSEATSQALHHFAREKGITLNTLMQGMWGLLLSRYTREADIVFGATVSGRPTNLPGAENIVGLLINTLPVRIRVNADMPALEWLRGIQANQAGLREFEYTSLIDIQGWSDVPRGTPLFESLLVFENYPASPLGDNGMGGLKVEPSESFTRTNYPLTFAISPGQQIGLIFAYETARFDETTIERLSYNLQTLLEGVLHSPDLPVGRLPLLAEAERQLVLNTWAEPSLPVDLTQTVLDLFAGQVQCQPEAAALRFEDRQMTYAELDRRSNQLAHHLIALGIQPGALVGICMTPCPEMVVGMLGVQKAGAAYLPVDPAYPADRIAFMIEDSQIRLLLTQSALMGKIPFPPDGALYLDEQMSQGDWPEIARQPETIPGIAVGPDDLAYIIYTSGSTGRPKGTLLSHRGLSNLVQVGQSIYDFRPGDVCLQFFTVSFDGSVWEIFTSLANGATLLLARREITASPDDLVKLLNTGRVTHMLLPPAMTALLKPEDLPHLRVYLTGGEVLPVEVARRWAGGSTQLINAYGPTEATIVSTSYPVQALAAETLRVPIGRPIPNTRALVLDEMLQPVPVGVPGELHVGGASLSKGYLNRPELTAARFIADPYHPGERLYKTGDLVRWLPGGEIDFLERLDDQVKIRGFRIELGEIEAVLLEHPAVRYAAVTVYDESQPGKSVEKSLVAYITFRDPSAPVSTAELTAHLKNRLPVFMVPAQFMILDSMPLSPSGKIDRRALPKPEKGQGELQAAFRAPRTPVEQGLAEIWQQVLHAERVGLDDDFFALGGHSLRAAQLVSRVREVFQVEFPLRDLFAVPVLAAMAAHVETLVAQSHGQATPPIQPVTHTGPIPLSFAQQRLWFLDQLAPGNLFYNLPMAVRLTGQLDIAALQKSLDEIVRRHSVLRTRFIEQNGQPAQAILPELHIPMRQVDLSALPLAEREPEALKQVAREAAQPFNLAEGPLVRGLLVKLGESDHLALLVMHHIVSDGWSLGVLLHELSALYRAFAAGQPSPLPDLPVQYADYAVWQRNWLSGAVLEEQLSYWKTQLANLPPLLEMPTDHPRPAVQSSNGALYSFELPADLGQALVELSQGEGATLYMTLLAAFQVLLARYSRQDDIPVGTAVANRSRSEIEGLIGFFVNTLVLRARLAEDDSFITLLQQVRETCLGAYAHQDLPFETLVETLQPERNLSHNPLFQIMFVLDPPLDEAISMPGLAMAPVHQHTGTATFDMTLSMVNAPDGLRGSIEYNTDLWERETIARLMANFTTLLNAIVADPEQPVWTLPLLAEPELRQVRDQWNQTAAPAPLDQCAHELFQAHARRAPEALALIFSGPEGKKTLTYRELDERTNQLARYLQKQGVAKETFVAVSTERSLESIIGILGTLKAGGAYLPVDPNYPPERQSFMMEDSGARYLLTQAHLADRLPGFTGTRICLDSGWAEIAQESTEALPNPVTPDNLAYIIYTSGSTGKPKGALLQHRGLCNLAETQRVAFNVTGESRELQFSPLSFDASVWEMIMALGNGAALVLAPQDWLASAPDLLRLLQDNHITHVTLPPSMLQVLPQTELPELRVVVAAGEACPAELVARWAPGRSFFNAYGPTETTVCASMYRCSADETGLPPIGKPNMNARLFVVDQHTQLMPIGAPGELLVGGVLLARGYHQRPEMTAEKFIADPFHPQPGSDRLYRTGDLVRWRADGNIEFLGRIDTQVKIRGFRIELGEIEEALRQHPNVLQAAVVAHKTRREGLADRLVGYIVPNAAPAPAAAELREHLRQTLPEYMVPSVFITLESMPLNASNKIDRRNLPAPETALEGEPREYIAPRNDTEAKLAEMCAALLNLERVGVTDNFFDLGGHSLLATQFISHIRETFKVEIALRSLFEHPTVADLAIQIEQIKASAGETGPATITRVSRDQYRRKRSETQ